MAGTKLNKHAVLTIEHSTHPIERFIEHLRQHGVTTVADVRSMPYSRFQPQFGREILAKALKDPGIKYVFLGKELGARSEDKSCYENGKVKYRRMAQTALFRSGIERIRTGSAAHCIAIMCAEGEPLESHRAILVGWELQASGTNVAHILADGNLESHNETMASLLQELKMLALYLFRTVDELMDEAYARQEERIGYVEESASIEEAWANA